MVSVSKKMLLYTIINENNYPGQGHIINIAKRHTNRRWRQYTPEKQCIIELELVKASMVTWLELRGYGTYILQIIFKNIQKKVITMIKYNFNFSDKQSINQPIACEQVVKYVSVKLVNSQQNPQRMGLDHFFMKGKVAQKSQSDEDVNQNNKQIKQNKIEQDEQAEYYNRKQKTKKQHRGKRRSKSQIEQDQYVYQLKNQQKIKPDKKVQKKQKRGNKLIGQIINLKQQQKQKQIKKSISGVNIPITITRQQINPKQQINSQVKQQYSQLLINRKTYESKQIQRSTNSTKQVILITLQQKKSIKQQLVEKLKKKKQQIARLANHTMHSNTLIKKQQI